MVKISNEIRNACPNVAQWLRNNPLLWSVTWVALQEYQKLDIETNYENWPNALTFDKTVLVFLKFNWLPWQLSQAVFACPLAFNYKQIVFELIA